MPCKNSLRALAGLLAGLAIGAVLIVVGAHWWLMRYLHSEAFRRLVSVKTAAALRAEGEFLPLQWSGATAYSDGFHARGLPGSPLKELRADQLRADFEITGLLRNTWRISGLDVQRLTAVLGSPTPAPTSRPSTAAESKSVLQVELQPLRIHDANIEWTTPGVSGAVRRAEMLVKWGNGFWETSASRGELHIANLPLLRIEQAQARFQRDEVFLRDSHFRLTDGGQLAINGQIGFGATAACELLVRHEGVPVDRWLPTDWRGRLVGLAHGESRVQGRLGPASAISATGHIELSNGKLEALPVLNRLAVFTGSEQFRQLQLQKARADYSWTTDRLIVHRLLMESTGLLRIEGGCIVEKGALLGEFDVGVAAATLRWLPGARGRVFTEERDGYRWTKVRLQGPTNDLQEDLSSRLIAAAGTEVIEDTKGIVQKGAETFLGIFRKLTQ